MDRHSKRTVPPALAQERALVRLATFYRYFSFMAALALMVAMPAARGQLAPLNHTLSLGLVGIYLVLWVLLPLHPQAGRPSGYAALALDLGVAMGSLLATGGANSGLLLYALAPVLAASLLLEQRVALATAALSTLALLVAHLTGRGFAWMLSGNTLATVLLYGIAAALVAVAPYYSNLNVRRRLEADATAAERRRLRRDVHDGLAQDIAALTMRAQQLVTLLPAPPPPGLSGELAGLQQALQKTYSGIRAYLDVLGLPAEVSLTSALAELAREFSSRTGITLETSFAQDHFNLSLREAVQFLAIAQEALANIQKHAGATRARLVLTASPAGVELLVEDNGRGFDAQGHCPPGHYGLLGMRERAQEIGATLAIASTPGRGAQVRLTLPR